MVQEVRIPDIGDIDEVEVIEICVAVGDQVGPDDALIVIESDKASMEVPAGVAGTIASIDVALGDQVAEGALVVTLEGADEATDAALPAPKRSLLPNRKLPRPRPGFRQTFRQMKRHTKQVLQPPWPNRRRPRALPRLPSSKSGSRILAKPQTWW